MGLPLKPAKYPKFPGYGRLTGLPSAPSAGITVEKRPPVLRGRCFKTLLNIDLGGYPQFTPDYAQSC
jgi:hypothetical protein